MRRLWLLSLLLVFLLVAGSAEAATPKKVEFVLTGHTVGIDEMIIRPHFVRIKGLHAEGTVTGSFVGSFTYTENIGASTDLNAAVTVGDVTITTAIGTIKVRFFGIDKVIPQEYGNPIVVVEDQPWVITGGTGAYAGIQGAGKRSTFTSGCTDEFCVRYTGRVVY